MSAAWGPERAQRAPPARVFSGLTDGDNDDDDDAGDEGGGDGDDELGEATAGADAARKSSSSLGSLSAFSLAFSWAS